MPGKPLHALIWSSNLGLYELYTRDRLEQRFRPADEGSLQIGLTLLSLETSAAPGGEAT